MCVVLLIYTCYGPFYNLFFVWEGAAGFAFLSSVLFLVGCSHVLLVLGTANSHFDAQYTRAGAAQKNLSPSHSDSWPHYEILSSLETCCKADEGVVLYRSDLAPKR